MTWDPGKPTRTRSGRPIRDLHRLSKPCDTGQVWIGIAEACDLRDVGGFVFGYDNVFAWFEDGGFEALAIESSSSLVNIEPERIKRTVFANVHEGFITLHTSDDNAKELRSSECLACIPIEVDCAVGEGLEEVASKLKTFECNLCSKPQSCRVYGAEEKPNRYVFDEGCGTLWKEVGLP